MIKRGLAISNHLHNRTRNLTEDHTQVLSVPTEDPGIDMVGQRTLWWGRVGEIPRKTRCLLRYLSSLVHLQHMLYLHYYLS